MEKLLTPKEVAKKLKVAVGTLAIWRHLKKPPNYIRLGVKSIRYKESELSKFINIKNKK